MKPIFVASPLAAPVPAAAVVASVPAAVVAVAAEGADAAATGVGVGWAVVSALAFFSDPHDAAPVINASPIIIGAMRPLRIMGFCLLGLLDGLLGARVRCRRSGRRCVVGCRGRAVPRRRCGPCASPLLDRQPL